MSNSIDFNLPSSDIKNYLYADCLPKVNALVLDALTYFTADLYGSQHDLYMTNLDKIGLELIRIEDVLSNLEMSPLYLEFRKNKIRLISSLLEQLNKVDLTCIQMPRLFSKISPATFLYVNYDNTKLIDKTTKIYSDWWDEEFNIYDFIEIVDSECLDTESKIARLQAANRFCQVTTTHKEEDDSFYIAHGIFTSVEPWLSDIIKSDSSFKYTLLTYRQVFIQSNAKLDAFDKLGSELYGAATYGLLCSMVDNSEQACDLLFWENMHTKVAIDSDISMPDLVLQFGNL